MKLFGRSALSEFIGDRVVYRNLQPCDDRLPGLDELRSALNLPHGIIPRKTKPEYAQVIALLLTKARELENRNGVIKRLAFIGDTRLLDGTQCPKYGTTYTGDSGDSCGSRCRHSRTD